LSNRHPGLLIGCWLAERKQIAMDFDAIIEELNSNPDADLDGSTLNVNEQLEESGQHLWWDEECETYVVGPIQDEEE